MNCTTIYYQSTNPTIQLGDFLYQNSQRTIPAAAGYYADNNNSIWYETDAEGVVINSGSCLDTGVVIASLEPTAFQSCLSASLCATASTYLTYDMSISSSRLTFSSSIFVSSNEYPYFLGSTGSMQALRGWAVNNGTASNNTSSANYPLFTGSNSMQFSGSLTGSAHGYARAVRITGSSAFTSDLADNYFQSVTQSTCVEVWFKANAGANSTGRKILIGNSNTVDDTRGWTVQTNMYQPGDIAFYMTPSATGQQVLVATTESFADNQWHCASIKYNPSGAISGNELVSASSLFEIIVDGKLREYYKVSGSNLINISGSNGSLGGAFGFNLAMTDPLHTPQSELTQFFNGRIGKVTLYNTGSLLPNNSYLRYQYYASRSIYNN